MVLNIYTPNNSNYMAALKSCCLCVLLQNSFPENCDWRPIIGNALKIPETKNANAKCSVHLKSGSFARSKFANDTKCIKKTDFNQSLRFID